MTSFTTPFATGPVNPAQVLYAEYSFSGDLTLAWPTGMQDASAVAAAIIDAIPLSGSLNIDLPNGLQGSDGAEVLFNNKGAFPFHVRDSSGGAVATLSSGVSQLVYLTSNAASPGAWDSIQYGASVANAQAAQLAGAGLQAAAGLLQVVWNVLPVAADRTVVAGDRDYLLEWSGGAGTQTFPDAANFGNNFYIGVSNQGTGSLVLAATPSIDGAATVTLAPTESCIVVSDGTKWVTLGRGRSSTYAVSTLNKSLAGSGNVNLTSVEAAAVEQEYTGALTGNKTVTYGAVANFYYIYNNTTGSYLVTLRATSADAGVVVTQGTRSIITNNGAVITNAVGGSAGTVLRVDTGTGLQGGPITVSGTITLTPTGGTPGTYGNSGNVPVVTVDAFGRSTVSSVPINYDNVILTGSTLSGGSMVNDVWYNVGRTISGEMFGSGFRLHGSGVSLPAMVLRNDAFATSGYIGRWQNQGRNSVGTNVSFAEINAFMVNTVAGAETGNLTAQTMVNGAQIVPWYCAAGFVVGGGAGDMGFGTLNSLSNLYHADIKVVGARAAGWTPATGTLSRATFDTAAVTLPQLAGRVAALIEDLYSTSGHGLIGA